MIINEYAWIRLLRRRDRRKQVHGSVVIDIHRSARICARKCVKPNFGNGDAIIYGEVYDLVEDDGVCFIRSIRNDDNRLACASGSVDCLCSGGIIGSGIRELCFGFTVAALAVTILIEVVAKFCLNGDPRGSFVVRKGLVAKRAAIPFRIIAVLFAGRVACIMLFKLVKGIKVTIKFTL